MISIKEHCARSNAQYIVNGQPEGAKPQIPEYTEVLHYPELTCDEVKKLFEKAKEDAIKNQASYISNPAVDFTRNRTWTFTRTVDTILNLGKESVQSGLDNSTDMSDNKLRGNAFCMARQKISHNAFQDMMSGFSKSAPSPTYKGFNPLGMDGSVLNIPTNRSEMATYHSNKKTDGGYNQLFVNGRVNLMDKTIKEAMVTAMSKKDERTAAAAIISGDDHGEPNINILDRGYEGYDLFITIIEKGEHFVCRVKEHDSNGILSGIELPQTPEFDTTHVFFLTRSQAKEMKEVEGYKLVPASQRIGRLETATDFYALKLRIVRIEVAPGKYETLVTDLLEEATGFTVKDLKYLYYLRWNHEVTYKLVKYVAGLIHLHSYFLENILQEVYATIFMYNVSRLTANCIDIGNGNTPVVSQKEYEEGCEAIEKRAEEAAKGVEIDWTKPVEVSFEKWWVNFSLAYGNIKRWLYGEGNARELCKRVNLNKVKYRPGRNFKRNVRPQHARHAFYC